jgi:hypothetical protein
VAAEVGLEGDPGKPVVLGRDSHDQTSGSSFGALVAGPVTLYIRDALSLGMLVGDGNGGGTLAVGRDQSGVSGNVEIQSNGFSGITCWGTANAPATITDTGSTAAHSLWLHSDPQGMYSNYGMLWSQGVCNVSLAAHPLFGPALDPVSGECVTTQAGDSISIHGIVSIQLSQAVLQCSASAAVRIGGNGSLGTAGPSVLLDQSLVQYNHGGIYASAGALTCKDTRVVHNGQGIYQDNDYNAESTIDLSGGGNQVTCNNGLGGDSFDIAVVAGTTHLQNMGWDHWGSDAGSTEIWTPFGTDGIECRGSETCPANPSLPLPTDRDIDLWWPDGQPLPDLTGGSAAADGCP